MTHWRTHMNSEVCTQLKSGAANCNINKSLLQPVNKYIFNATLSGIYIDPGLFRNCTQDHQDGILMWT